MTKVLSNQTVLEAGLDRIRMVFDRFTDPIVSFSGGKDSTVCLNLAAMVAKERGRPHLNVAFLDQEAEWASVIDYMRRVRERPDVRLHWFQFPFLISNNANSKEPFLRVWDPAGGWMREKEDGTITDPALGAYKLDGHNGKYPKKSFHQLFPRMLRHIAGDGPACFIAGMRAEESPVRMMALTYQAKFRGITWAKRLEPKRESFTFYPIYDWTYRDVWKAIHDHGWDYCRVYDLMYQKGVPVRRMRVSNLNHETALDSLRYLQEVEPKTWEALCKRLPGIAAAGGLAARFFPTTLPPMFETWRDYRDHLLATLIQPDMQILFVQEFARLDREYRDKGMHHFDSVVCRLECQVISVNDFEFTKIRGWEWTKEVDAWRRYTNKGLRNEKEMHRNKLISG